MPFCGKHPFAGAGLALAFLAGAAILAGSSGARAQSDTAARSEARRPVIQRLVLALYEYGYQGDPRKPIPTRGIRDAQGRTLLTHHPWESVGPWLSYDRAQWHKQQFQMMAESGIDVALALYRGDRESRRSFAVKGLDVMTQALKELRSEGLSPLMRAREYPMLGLALDLGSLAAESGGPVDLRRAEAQGRLYAMVREFFLHVPEEFRATVQLPATRREAPGNGGTGPGNAPQGAAYIVRLVGDEAVREADDSAIRAVSRRFAREFGAELVWIGTPALKARMPSLDAVAPYPAALAPAAIHSDGWIRTGSLGPGYDDTAVAGRGTIRPRESGQQTVLDFRRILAAGVEWVVLDSWNGFANGTDIAPTMEYGLLYRDLIRGATLQFKQSSDWAAAFLKAFVPRAMQPGQIYQCEVLVQNTGNADWDTLNAVALSYRWLKDGTPVGDPGPIVTVNRQAQGETKRYVIGVTPPLREGRPLPPGAYELEFLMLRRQGGTEVRFEEEGAAPYRIPISVGPTGEFRAAWVSSSMTSLARQGARYPAEVRLRNDGSQPWRAGSAALVYRWRKVDPFAGPDGSDTLIGEGGRIPLPEDVPPGRLATVPVQVAIADSAGQPLPVLPSPADGAYVLEWDLSDGSRLLSQTGSPVYREPVVVVERDPAPSFLGCNLSAELVAGRTEKITVGLRNIGPETWKKDRDQVAVHWYYLDGTEAAWNDSRLPLPEDVPPFSQVTLQVPIPDDSATVVDPNRRRRRPRMPEKRFRTETIVRDLILREVPVQVPYYFGPMYCVLDLVFDGRHASTGPASKGNDLLVLPVNIYSPTFTPLPLFSQFNVDGMSHDGDRTDGNLDGRGNTFPAEALPPYVPRPGTGLEPAPSPSPLYPSGLWVRPLNHLDSTRVCFMYPNKENGRPNMIRCDGQRIPFGALPRTAVHVLAAATEEDVSGEFTLYYSDGSTEKRRVTFTHWNDPPRHGERIGFVTGHRHTAIGDDTATRCYLHHYTIPANHLKQLVGIELPREPAIKVVAITLEAATLRSN